MPDFEELRVRISGDSSLEKDFKRDERAAGRFEKTVNSIFGRIKDQSVHVEFEADGTAEVLSEAGAVDEAIDRIDGRDVNARFDFNASGGIAKLAATEGAMVGVTGASEGLIGSLKSTAGTLRASHLIGQVGLIGAGLVAAAAGASPAAAGIGAVGVAGIGMNRPPRSPKKKLLATGAGLGFGTNVGIIVLYGLEKLHDFPDPVAGAIIAVTGTVVGLGFGYLVPEEQ